jgi:hypothetical protein
VLLCPGAAISRHLGISAGPADPDAAPGRWGHRRHRHREARIDARIGELVPTVVNLDAIPGVGPVAAQMILAEVGTNMSRFPTPRPPGFVGPLRAGGERVRRPAEGQRRHGNPYLARVVGEAAVSAGRTDTFLGERYQRIARRRGKKRAIVAIGRSILVIAWALFSDTEGQFSRSGPLAGAADDLARTSRRQPGAAVPAAQPPRAGSRRSAAIVPPATDPRHSARAHSEAYRRAGLGPDVPRSPPVSWTGRDRLGCRVLAQWTPTGWRSPSRSLLASSSSSRMSPPCSRTSSVCR